jgi:hypothetical protein
MENISIIAKKIFEEIPESTWSGKNLMEIEGEIQKILNEIGNELTGNNILPARVKEIEEGQKRCDCGRDYGVQKKGYIKIS